MKKSRALRTIMSVALIVMLCMSFAATAFAADPTSGPIVMGTEAAPAAAAINKTLKMPIGTYTPAATFTFEFTKLSLDDSTATADLAAMPAIADKSISFTTADAGTTDGDVKTVVKESGNIAAGLTFSKPGVYRYIVTEKTGTYTLDAAHEDLTYSGASYRVAFWVENNAAGTGTYIRAISSIIVITDSSNLGNEGTKVDPTPGGDPNVEGDYSQMVFTNVFVRYDGTKPTDPAPNPDPSDPALNAFALTKKVAGGMADKSKYFTFSVGVTKNSLIDGTPTYRAYVLDAAGAVVTTTDNYATIGADKSISFTSGTNLSVKLKDGQTLYFVDVPVGTQYNVSESGSNGYTPSYSHVVNNGTAATKTGAENGALVLGSGTLRITEELDTATYTNTAKDVTPTGIAVNDLPYIALFAVVIGAFVSLAVVRSRKRSGEAE